MAGTPCDHRAVWLPPCPLQFLIHCEGTRFTEKKHQVSMQVAQAKGLPSLKHHLLPRTKGFAITVRGLRDVGKGEPGPAKPPPHPCRAELCPWHRFPSRLGTGRGSGDKGDSCTTGEPGSRPLAAACTREHTHTLTHTHTLGQHCSPLPGTVLQGRGPGGIQVDLGCRFVWHFFAHLLAPAASRDEL